MLQNAGNLIAEALTTMADSGNLPAVFHCTAGKDRTGVLAAIVLGVLGVDDEQIMDDYLLTNQTMDQLGRRLLARPGNEHRSPESLYAQPGPIESMLANLRYRYGDPVNYARANGVSDASIGRLKESLLQ